MCAAASLSDHPLKDASVVPMWIMLRRTYLFFQQKIITLGTTGVWIMPFPTSFFYYRKFSILQKIWKKKIAPRGSERDPLRLGEGTSPRDSLGKIHSQQRGSKCKCPEVETGLACWGPIRVSGYRMCGPWGGSGAIWRWFCFSFWRGEDRHKQMLQGLSGSGEHMGFRGMTWFDLHCTWTILAVITRLETGECLGGCCSW